MITVAEHSDVSSTEHSKAVDANPSRLSLCKLRRRAGKHATEGKLSQALLRVSELEGLVQSLQGQLDLVNKLGHIEEVVSEPGQDPHTPTVEALVGDRLEVLRPVITSQVVEGLATGINVTGLM